MIKLEIKLENKKLQVDINREAAKILTLSVGKVDKYEYLTGEKILPADQRRVIEQAKFTYSPLDKAFEKPITTIKDQGERQLKVLEEHGKQLIKYNNEKLAQVKAGNTYEILLNKIRQIM